MMTITNSSNIVGEGVVVYDGAGDFDTWTVLPVSLGGLGRNSATSYGVILGGDISTNPTQSVSSVGTAGQVLVSAGVGSRPQFQNSQGYIITRQTLNGDPPDGSTEFMRTNIGFTAASLANQSTKTIIPKSGTIKAAYGIFTCTAGSSQNASLYVRVNDTTDYAISTTLDFSSSSFTFNNTSLSIPVSAGDVVLIKFVSPTWTTNPTNVRMCISIYVE